MKQEGQDSYFIKDGDIACTPETEPTYSFVWNLCGKVTQRSVPEVCAGKDGAALQYVVRASDGYKECEILGHYDALHDDAEFSVMDVQDPSKGVSMKYADGNVCESGAKRASTIDVHCENVESVIVSALEPEKCHYHMIMKSYYGCPTECPITDGGLCNSHGRCMFDSHQKTAYCYCNEGWYGTACDSKTKPPSTAYDGYSVQLGFLITLVFVTIALVVLVAFMVMRINYYRDNPKATANEPMFEVPAIPVLGFSGWKFGGSAALADQDGATEMSPYRSDHF
jgi:hypothetical protein